MSDTPQRETALTPEEWAEQIAHDVAFSRTSGHGEIAAHVYVTLADVRDGGVEAVGDTEAIEIHWGNTERVVQLWNRRKLAALCLYQQPFGFSQEDVRALEYLAQQSGADTTLLRSIANRIKDLLPPSSPTP